MGDSIFEGRDSRFNHGMLCYCAGCTESAVDWYVWRSADGKIVGRRFWTLTEAQAVKRDARAHGLTVLWYCMANGGAVRVLPFHRSAWRRLVAWVSGHSF